MAVDGKLIFDSGIDNSGFTKDVNALSAAAGVALGNIAADIISNISAAVAEIPKQMVAIGSAYESSMSQVAATMGITAGTEAYEQLAQAAKDAGNSTKFSASEASSALNFLALSGMNAAQSVEALPTVLNTAAAAGMDLADASDLITDAMSALGLEMSDLATFSDQLAATAKSSNTSVAQLGEGILTVGGTAKILSGGVTELNTALGILADNGIKGAEGGTVLRNIILSLSAPTNTAAAALESLGLSASLAFDEAGAMRELPDIVGDLNTALAELSDQDRTAVLSEIFNKTDLKAVNALLGTSAERFDELSGKIDNAEGAAAQMAETMNDNLSGDMTVMQSALEGLGIAAYEKFQEPMRDAVQGVTASIGDLTESLTNGELSDSFDTISEAASNAVNSITTALSDDIIPTVVTGLSTIIDHGNEIIAMVGGIGAAVATFNIVPHIVKVVAAVQTANLNLALLSAQAGAAAVSETALAGGLTLTELAVGALTGKIPPLVAAKGALKMINDQLTVSLVASKIAMAGLAAVAIAGALALKNYMDNADFSIKEDALVEKTREETEALREQREAFEDLKKSQEEKIDADMVSANNIKRLWEELQNYVDENGNVISSNERASEIIGLLNENYNMNIGFIDGQIQGYQELAGSMDSYLEKLRLESRIRNGQETYDEAVANYDNYVKQREELARREETLSQTAKKYHDQGLYDAEKDIAAQRNAIQLEIDELDLAISGYEAEMQEYESLFVQKPDNTGPQKTSAEMYAEEYARKSEESFREYGEKLTEEQEKATKKLQEAWKKLDHEYATGVITSDNDLYSKRLELLNKYGDESNSDHWNYYEKLYDMEQDFSSKTSREYEDRIQAQADALKEKKELNDDFTDEMYYDELEALISTLDKESDLYKKYNYEILKGRKDLAGAMTAEAEKQSKELKNTIGKDLDSILSEYQKAFNELENKRQSYKRKLMSMGGDLFSVNEIENEDGSKTTEYVVNNIDEQIKKMQKYHDDVKKLKDMNVSDEVLTELTTLNTEDGQQFANYLAGMSEAEIAQINELYEKKEALADELSKDFYSKEAQNLSDAFKADLVDSSQNYGKEAADNYIDAFKEEFDSRKDEFSELFGSLDGYDLTGSMTVESAVQNVPADAYQYEDQSVDMLMEGFRQALSELYDQFAAVQMNVSAAITAGQNLQGNYGGSSWSDNSKTEKIVIENRDEITVKVDKDVLGKTVNEWTKEYERRSGT